MQGDRYQGTSGMQAARLRGSPNKGLGVAVDLAVKPGQRTLSATLLANAGPLIPSGHFDIHRAKYGVAWTSDHPAAIFLSSWA